MIDGAGGTDDLPPDVVLPQLALVVAATLHRFLCGNPKGSTGGKRSGNPQVAQLVNEVGPGYALHLLSAYLERQMEAGRLRCMNPHIAARLLIGPLIAHTADEICF